MNLKLNLFHINTHCIFIIRGCKIIDKQSLFTEFAQQLQFPAYFGYNWDAFADCLKDLSWLGEANAYFIGYQNSHYFEKHNAAEWQIADEIFQEATAYWQQLGKSRCILKTNFLPFEFKTAGNIFYQDLKLPVNLGLHEK